MVNCCCRLLWISITDRWTNVSPQCITSGLLDGCGGLTQSKTYMEKLWAELLTNSLLNALVTSHHYIGKSKSKELKIIFERHFKQLSVNDKVFLKGVLSLTISAQKQNTIFSIEMMKALDLLSESCYVSSANWF